MGLLPPPNEAETLYARANARIHTHVWMGNSANPDPMERNDRMAILTAVTIQPRSAEVWDDLQKLLKRIKDMVAK